MNVFIEAVDCRPDRQPKVFAYVDGVRVSYRVRGRRVPGDAWHCAEHRHDQTPHCSHVVAVLHELPTTVLNRVTGLDEPGYHPASGAR